MPLVDVSEVITDPDFNQTFTVYRKKGTWNNGRFVVTENSFTANGIIISQSNEELDITPQGALISSQISIWTYSLLYVTSQDGTPQTDDYLSDEVEYKGQRYLITAARNMIDYGYYKYNLILKVAS